MNLLFLAFEREAVPLARLAQRFKAKGHEVFIASCDHFFVTHDREQIPGMYRSAGLSDREFTNLDEVFRAVNECPEDMPEEAVDWGFLREFDARYCEQSSVLELIATDPQLSGAYHHRDIYYRPKNKSILFKSAELHLKWLERMFHEHSFDAVITLNNQYFIKGAAFAMAQSLGIPFLTVTSCRIRSMFLIHENFGLSTPEGVRREMRRLEAISDPCADAEDFVDGLRKRGTPAWSDAKRWSADVETRLSIGWRVGYFWRTLKRARGAYKNRRYRGLLRRDYFLPSYVAMLRTLVINLGRRIGFFRHEVLFESRLPKGPFVFFPLHVIPESTVLTSSRTFDEKECVFQLSKLLPPDWKVVVKVNINMLGHYDTHPNDYYLEMYKFPNVQFIDPRILSPAVIERASAVACIAGTALLEGAALGKPGFRWGRVDFDSVDSIHEFDPRRFRAQLTRPARSNVKYYIQACFNVGMELDHGFALLMKEACSSHEEREEYDRQLACLQNGIEDHLATSDAGERKMRAALS